MQKRVNDDIYHKQNVWPITLWPQVCNVLPLKYELDNKRKEKRNSFFFGKQKEIVEKGQKEKGVGFN